MALTGNQKAYLSARSGIARSGAIRSNYVFPLNGVITIGGINITPFIQYGSLRVVQALNEQPDTAAFDVRIVDATVNAAIVIGADVVMGLGGPTDNPLFGGRILTTQTTRRHVQAGLLRSVMCADYLQVADSEYLVTYDWPAQSATTTILDLMARFYNKPGGVALSTAAVAANLPNHAAFGVSNEKLSTVLRRMVTTFPGGGGFYVDPLKVLHVWQGASEPNQSDPAPLTNASTTLKQFSETRDGAQVRDAVIVEGARTTALIGSPALAVAGSEWTIPVSDASIAGKVTNQAGRELRVGSQRVLIQYASGPWSSPAGASQSTTVTADIPYVPTGSPAYTIPVADQSIFTGRPFGLTWVKIDESYLRVLNVLPGTGILVPRTGFGSLAASIKSGAAVTLVDSFGLGTLTNRYNLTGWEGDATKLEPTRAQAIDADVVMTVRTSQAPAIHEHIVQDGRYTRDGAANRGAAELAAFSAPLVSIRFETTDLNARPGRVQAYDFTDVGGIRTMGAYTILTAELTWPVWGLPPWRVCTASDVHEADVTDAWLVDRR